MAYGQNSNIAFCFQNSYGTEQVSSLYFLPHLADGVKLEKPDVVDEAMRGVFDEGDSYEGLNKAGGDFATNAQAIGLGVLLKGLMGDPTTVASDGHYTHTFRPRTADFDEKCANNPLTYYRYLETGSAELFYDMNISALELGVVNGELMKAKATLVGGSHKQIANVSASYPVGKKFTWDVASISIGATGRDEMLDLTIVFDDQLEATHTLNGSRYPARIKRTGMRTVSVNGTLKFDNQDEYQQFIAQSERELVLNFKGPTAVDSGYYEEVRITLPALRYTDIPVAAGGPGEIEASFTAKGKFHVGSAVAGEVVLVNTQAAY